MSYILIRQLKHFIKQIIVSNYVDENYNEFYTSKDLIACANSYDECSCNDNDIDFEELKNIINRNALKYFKDILISVGIPKNIQIVFQL